MYLVNNGSIRNFKETELAQKFKPAGNTKTDTETAHVKVAKKLFHFAMTNATYVSNEGESLDWAAKTVDVIKGP